MATLGLLAYAVGLIGGLTGVGGFIMAPVMIEFLAIPPHMAMALTQASFILPSALAVVLFSKSGNMNWPLTWSIALPGSFLSLVTTLYIKPRVDGEALSILLALCIILAGYQLTRSEKAAAANAVSSKTKFKRRTWIAIGGAVGILSGLTGSGANAIILPIMLTADIDVLGAIGTCQFFTFLVSAAGTYGNAVNIPMDIRQALIMTIGLLAGTWVGVYLAKRVSRERLRSCIALVCILAGAVLLLKNAFVYLRTW